MIDKSLFNELRQVAASIRAQIQADSIPIVLPRDARPQRKPPRVQAGDVAVGGYTRRDGTKVSRHRRAKPGGRS